MDKDEILETYLNSVPFGGNTRGVEAAARYGGAAEARDGYGRFRSTLDSAMRRLLTGELTAALGNMEPGVTAAAVLVENETGKVRGYVGNAREGTGSGASWVDCALSPRSPGSTLKPFVYALAFESGRAIPATMLADTPQQPSGGGTRNFDRLFRGPVSARTALADSLNVPAVRILRAAGAENVLGLFRRLGFSQLTREAEWYGDSLALGGCEVSPLELARAYRTLAAGGLDSPLVWNERAGLSAGTRVISAEAAALTLDILKDTRRNLPLYGEAGADGNTVAFKTGTSYGLRDAWTAAVTRKWTLVVWFGDPGGRPHRGLVGLKTAAPSAVRIMLKLTKKGDPWFTLPPSVVRKELCALSGAPRNQWCPQSRRGLFIEGVSDAAPCSLHTMKEGEISIKMAA